MRVDQLYDVLFSQILSEKATEGSDAGKYVFKVSRVASKAQIAMAVQKAFDVNVMKVNIINIPGKKKMFKQIKGFRSGFKKAVVTLQKGQVLDLMSLN